MSQIELDTTYSRIPMSQIWQGRVMSPPLSIDDGVGIIVPEMNPDFLFTNVRWEFKDDQNLPEIGDEVLVCFDNNNAPWIVAWVQSGTYVPPSGGGGGGASFNGIFRWTTALTGGPANGYVGIDKATWATSGVIRVSEITKAGNDVTNFWGKLQANDQLVLQDAGNSSNICTYILSAPGTDNGTWWSFNGTIKGSTGVPPANNADTLVVIYLAGSQV